MGQVIEARFQAHGGNFEPGGGQELSRPDQSLVSNGYAIADPARTKILYFLMGKNDRYDSGDGDDESTETKTIQNR
jgi:hypothetical protein